MHISRIWFSVNNLLFFRYFLVDPIRSILLTSEERSSIVCETCFDVFAEEDTYVLHKRFHQEGRVLEIAPASASSLNEKNKLKNGDNGGRKKLCEKKLDVVVTTDTKRYNTRRANNNVSFKKLFEDHGNISEDFACDSDAGSSYASDDSKHNFVKGVLSIRERKQETVAAKPHQEIKLEQDAPSCDATQNNLKVDSVIKKEGDIKISANPIRGYKKLYESFPTLESHIIVSSNGELMCKTCKNTYKYVNGLKIHILIKHLNAIFCCSCYELFETKDVKKIHMLSKHPRKCMECDSTFITKKGLDSHIGFAHSSSSYTCNICNKTYRASHLVEEHVKRVHDKPGHFKCVQCSKVFSNKSYLYSHVQRQHKKEMVVCDTCGKSFTRKCYLQKHKINVHSNTPLMYECKLCKKPYKSRMSSKICENKHKGNKEYKCNSCDKAYYTKTSLIIHTRIHTGEKPFECWLCDRRFYTHQILLKHALSHGLTADQFRSEYRRRYGK